MNDNTSIEVLSSENSVLFDTTIRSTNAINGASLHTSQLQSYTPITAKGHKEFIYTLAMNDVGTLLVSRGPCSGCRNPKGA
jgi:hypothetical protein